MPPRRRIRAREAQIAFEAISIEGGLLSPEWLSRVAQLGAGQQSDADYRIPKGLNVRDEIGRYWRIAQAHWKDLDAGRKGSADSRALAVRFVTGLLRDALGFGTLAEIAPVELEGRTYPVGHSALSRRVPVVIAPAGTGIDGLDEAFGDVNRRRSAFGLAQEYLNAASEALWGLATDGLVLRVLRDNASLTRPAWIEADLERIFTEERYADFAALWLVAHESRFGREGDQPSECALEAWRSAGREEGTRAREHLRSGVEEALIALGTGFLTHPANAPLRAALHDGTLTPHDYFQELLRLVYRLIFLLTAEERGVLHPPMSDESARRLYEQGYAMRRLRDRAVKRSAHDRFADLWEGVRIVLCGLAAGEPRLALPALGGIFAAGQCPHIDGAKLENRFLLQAMFKLSWLREESGLSRVNWRDMGPEELGSVYESLLELAPRVTGGGRRFEFATSEDSNGNARRSTGSYYTPDSLVQVLLDSALDPVIDRTIAANPEAPAAALLKLAVVDPACGSGHFLLAAGRRLAVTIARLRANGTPSAAEYRGALRDVVSRCLFGVDLNPMAVELCRVSLWMEAVEPGRPLSFLDSHVQHGDALLGATPELIAQGIPDAAWEPVEGDDRKSASALKKRNKAAATGQRGMAPLWGKSGEAEARAVATAVAELDAAPDLDLAALTRKERRWGELHASAAFRHQRFVADAWCAAFVWPKPPSDKTPLPILEAAPTNDLWRQMRDGQGEPPELTTATVKELAERYRFFHWHLAFPQVFARGGFDVVLGNPPYLSVQSKVIPKQVLRFLRAVFPTLEKIGDYAALFAETAIRRLAPGGHFGLVLPSTILLNLSFAGTRELLLANGTVDDLVQLGDGAFEGAVVPTCLVGFSKRHRVARTRVAIRDAVSGEYRRKEVELREIAVSPHFVFGIEQDESAARVLKGIAAASAPLKEFIDIKEGIKTGNDGEFLSGSPFPSLSRPVVRGRDVSAYGVKPCMFIKYDPSALSRPQKLELFAVPEKLFIRRVGAGLTAAHDSQGLLCVHTLYVGRPRPGTPCELKYILALLNSDLMNWVYRQTHMKKGDAFAEVRIHALNGLPVIVAPPEVQRRIVRNVEVLEAEARAGRSERSQVAIEAEAALNAEMCRIYGVDPSVLSQSEDSAA
jgi:hypothetical protein